MKTLKPIQKIFHSKDLNIAYEKGRADEQKRILEIIKFCKVCDGSHGEWIRKDELKAKIKEEK